MRESRCYIGVAIPVEVRSGNAEWKQTGLYGGHRVEGTVPIAKGDENPGLLFENLGESLPDSQVHSAIPVEIAGGEADPSYDVRDRRLDGPVTVSKKHLRAATALVGRKDIQLAVAVHIGKLHREGVSIGHVW
jgi:hypothetical protein